MKYSTAVKLFAAIVTVAAVCVTQSASAQSTRMIRPELNPPAPHISHVAPRLQPQQPSLKMILPGDDFDLPKLGFFGYVTPRGMVVTKVMPGTPAWRIGLEPGDRIVSIEGYRITREGDYERGLRRAYGDVNLQVADVRGRGIISVNVDLDRPMYYSRPVVGLQR